MSTMIDGLNLLDGSWYAEDPHGIFDGMRRTDPVHYDPVGAVWGVFKHAEVLTVERDAKTFSSHRAPRPHGEHLPMMISMDDPEHQRRRSLVNRGFTPKRVAAHQPMIRQLCREIINRVCEKGSCDFAARLPLYVIADLLGYEPDLYDDLLRCCPSANLDEHVFEHPHAFDVGRSPNPHVAFGIGTHFCLGASLARLEVRMMVAEALRRLPDLDLATEEPLPRRASNFVSGFESMPVTFTPTPVEV